jgi:TrmH family RNA methyltransferase
MTDYSSDDKKKKTFKDTTPHDKVHTGDFRDKGSVNKKASDRESFDSFRKREGFPKPEDRVEESNEKVNKYEGSSRNRAERPERAERSERPERSERSERPSRDGGYGGGRERSSRDDGFRGGRDRSSRDEGYRGNRDRSDKPEGYRGNRDRSERPSRDGNSEGKRDFKPTGKRQIALPDFLNAVRSLHQERGRDKEQAFLVEGINCVDEVLDHSPEIIKEIFYRNDFENEACFAKILSNNVRAKGISPLEFNEISSTKSNQGIIAVCRTSQLKPNWTTARMVTLVDAVQDPGNLGAIFRSSLGFNMDAVILGSGTCDPYNSKVVRGSSGTFLRMPFESQVDLAERIRFLQSKGFTVVATSSHAKEDLSILAKKKKIAFLVGNEGSGANSRYVDMANEWVKIPMAGGLESLNVAVAHGVVAWELSKLK